MTSTMETEHSSVGRAAAIPTQPATATSESGRMRPSVNRPRVAVIGLGYVGLPTALSFATGGAIVIGYDINAGRVSDIEAGRVDLLDGDFKRLESYRGTSELTFVSSPEAIASADVVIICVPTPVDQMHVPDLTALSHACDQVVARSKVGQSIILTSTTYVGCTREMLVERLEARGLRIGVDVNVAFSPERIDPGNAAHVPERTPRVVGGATPRCAEVVSSILSSISADTYSVSSLEVAELAKLLENSFRAVNIALANEFADVARHFRVDPMEVVEAAATKPFGFMPFYPGAGAGGHCIPCDPHYLLWQLRASRHDSPITQSAMNAIAARPRAVVRRARDTLANMRTAISGAQILVVGVSYKPNVADLRNSPALEIIEELMQLGANVAFTDPLIDEISVRSVRMKRHVDVGGQPWDLAIIHTLHDEIDSSFSGSTRAVLDTTYRATRLYPDSRPEYHAL